MLDPQLKRTSTPIADDKGVIQSLYFHRNGVLYKYCGTSDPGYLCSIWNVQDLIKNQETGVQRWMVRHEWVHNAYACIKVKPKQSKRAKVSRK